MECRIQFHKNNIDQFDWCKLDEATGETIESGQLNITELNKLCSDGAKVLVFLPQQDILLTSPELPAKANKQHLNSIAFSIEELLAEDIETCFFAVLPQQSDHSVPVAVINAEVMDNWMQLLSTNHVNAKFILPQIYLCPWSSDDDLLASICLTEQGYLIRTGKHQGLICHSAIISQMLALLEKNKSSNQHKLVFYGDELPNDFESSNLVIEKREPINLLAQSINPRDCINLKQKKYQSSHQWMGLIKQWKWPMVAMLFVVFVFIADILLDGWQKEQIYADVISQQKTVLTQKLPDLVVSNQPKKQLIEMLAESRGNGGQVGFLDLLHEYSRLKNGVDAVNTTKIQFQQSRLVVNLETRDLTSMESFKDKLRLSSFKVNIENVSINPEKTTGRLVMEDPR